MGRYRSRSRSYSPRRRSRTPTRGTKRYDDDPRDRHRSHRDHGRSPLPSGLLIRNLPLDARDRGVRDDYRSRRQSGSISQDRGMRDDYCSPSRSRSISRDRGAKDDYHSPRRSKSVSRSLSLRSPHGDGENRTKQRSSSPRENGWSPHDERDYVRGRSRSPRRDKHSPSRSRPRSFRNG